MEEECIHGLMVGTCSLCKRAAAKGRVRRGVSRAFTMEALFDSHCPGCGGYIGRGEQIYAFEGEAFVCETCAVEEELHD